MRRVITTASQGLFAPFQRTFQASLYASRYSWCSENDSLREIASFVVVYTTYLIVIKDLLYYWLSRTESSNTSVHSVVMEEQIVFAWAFSSIKCNDLTVVVSRMLQHIGSHVVFSAWSPRSLDQDSCQEWIIVSVNESIPSVDVLGKVLGVGNDGT
jgi:hypothetical protein